MESQNSILIFIAVGSLTMLSLVLGIISFFNISRRKILQNEAKIKSIELNTQLEIFRAVSNAQDTERRKIASALHDEIIAMLSAVQRSIDKNISDYKTGNFDIERLKRDCDFLEQTTENARSISHDLIPNTLLSFGLIKALKYYIGTLNNIGNSISDLENKTNFEENVPFTVQDQLNIYRAFLEIMNNLIKHANYSYLKVIIEQEKGNFIIDIMHDGKGISNEKIEALTNSSVGLGLKSIKSRMLLLNATVNYLDDKETPGINISIPIKQ